jgi:hypothetical protein
MEIEVPKWSLNHSGIVISKNVKEWSKKVNARLIHRTLSDEIALRIIMLQRYKISQNPENRDKMTILLHNFDLDDFKLHPKLYIYLKYHNEALNIEVVEIDTIPDFPIWPDLHHRLDISKLEISKLGGCESANGRENGNTETETESH